jgi:hypothetical protein
MRRRTLILVTASAIMSITVGSVLVSRTARSTGRIALSPAERSIMARVAHAVLEGALPADETAREQVIRNHLERLEQTIAGLSSETRSEVHTLLALLESELGRRWLFGMNDNWQHASEARIRQSLVAWRNSRWKPAQQAYHALRDLTNASFFSAPSAWATLGYPGPRSVVLTAQGSP